MDILAEMAYEIKQIKSQLANMMRLGNVAKVHAAEGLVDVAYDDLIIERVPLFMRRAGEDREYWMPSVGEQGMLLSPSGDLNNATFHVGIHSDKIPVPSDDEKWTTREWKDDTKETYDRDKHHKEFHIPNKGGRISQVIGTPIGAIAQEVFEIAQKEIKIQDESKTKRVSEKLELSQKEIKVQNPISTGMLTIKPSEIEGSLITPTGIVQLKMTAGQIEIRIGATWMVLTPALANINGFTIVGGVTNLIPGTGNYVVIPA